MSYLRNIEKRLGVGFLIGFQNLIATILFTIQLYYNNLEKRAIPQIAHCNFKQRFSQVNTIILDWVEESTKSVERIN
jgi:hypothetical protein